MILPSSFDRLRVLSCPHLESKRNDESYRQLVGLLGWGASQLQGRYLQRATETQKNPHTHIHASNGIRTHDPNVRVGEYISWSRQRSQCDGRHGIR
jgi:hypothetical protein